MEIKVSKKVIFYKNSLIIKKRKRNIEINFQDIDRIIYIKNSFWNWLTGRTHAVIPGRIHIFLKNGVRNTRYSFKIKNDIFNTLPLTFTRLLPDKYKNY